MKKMWDLTYLYESKDKWEEEIIELEARSETLEKSLPVCKTIEEFECWVKEKIKMDEQMERIYCYPRRLIDLNQDSKEAKDMFQVALICYGKTEKRNAEFIDFVDKNFEFVYEFLRIKPYYRRYFDIIQHGLDHRPRNIEFFTQTQEQLEKVKEEYRALIRHMDFGEVLDESGNLIKASEKSLGKMSGSSNHEMRKRGFEGTMKAYGAISNQLAELYRQKKELEHILTRHKRFRSMLEEQLYENDLPSGIVSKLIEVAHQNIDIEHSFVALKKENSKLDDFHIYDMNMKQKLDKKILLEEAKEILVKVCSIFGPDYVKRLEEGFENGSLDLEATDTKRKDSFSCITYSGLPYTMLTYKASIDSLRVLAHETGHMMHTLYAKENDFIYFEYPIFLAEIASKVHEMLLYHYLLEQSSGEEKRYILEQMLSSFCTSFFSQMMLTEFELEVDEKKDFGVPNLNQLYLSLSSTYYGSSMEMDELLGVYWTKIPHFFLYPSFYVWQYATGIVIASKIASDLIEDKNGMRKKYIEFLKAGNRLNVIDSLAIIGIDLNDDTYVKDACSFMRENIKVLQK